MKVPLASLCMLGSWCDIGSCFKMGFPVSLYFSFRVPCQNAFEILLFSASMICPLKQRNNICHSDIWRSRLCHSSLLSLAVSSKSGKVWGYVAWKLDIICSKSLLVLACFGYKMEDFVFITFLPHAEMLFFFS